MERCEEFSWQDSTSHDLCPSSKFLTSFQNFNGTNECGRMSSCHSCLHNTFGCVWCAHGCAHLKCQDYDKGATRADECADLDRWRCKNVKTCDLCISIGARCEWINNKECVHENTTSSLGSIATLDTPKVAQLPPISSTRPPPSHTESVPSFPFNGGAPSSGTCSANCAQQRSCVNCTQVGVLKYS